MRVHRTSLIFGVTGMIQDMGKSFRSISRCGDLYLTGPIHIFQLFVT